MSQNPLDLFEHSLMQKILALLRSYGLKGGKVAAGSISGILALSQMATHHHTAAEAKGQVDHADLTGVSADQHHARAHSILSVDHGDTDAADVPVEGDHLVYRSGQWLAEAPAVGLAESLLDDDGGLLVDDDGDLLSQDAA